MQKVYILFSSRINRFYTGSTDEEVAIKLESYNNSSYSNKFTEHGIPWELFLEIKCSSKSQARKIESHIKKMKNRKFIADLKKYPEMIDKLLAKFKEG